MELQTQWIQPLELNKILERLAEQATLPDAREMALSIRPETDFIGVQRLLRETEEAYLLLARFSSPSFGRASSVSPILSRAGAGGMLSIKELLQLAETLRAIRAVKTFRDNCTLSPGNVLDDYFSVLYPNRYFEDRILTCIKSEDEMNDTASPALAGLRRKISACGNNIRSRLDRIVKDAGRNKYLQDALITQRDGRFVVPVKSEYRSEVPGIVHDTSASGATLFVEPMSVVEINNELRVLVAKEREEVERILRELSAEAYSFADTIESSYQALVKLNLIFAKAGLAYKMKASVPQLTNDGRIRLKNARHPLIDPAKVVANTIELGTDYRLLIITGPNTGGKTVTLKTVGLLVSMVCCGFMIPVDDGSVVSVFDRILVDIGDEQSIEQSLSTFSSHMVRLVKILENADRNSLVLLDELGAGTDPTEGAALARAILEELFQKGCIILATTHYAELKAYALDTPGVENASCEFDVQTLKPTYRLLIGMPGRSNAFAISGRLGLNPSIIEKARNYVSEEDTRFETVISALETARNAAESEKAEAAVLRASLAAEKAKLDGQLHEISIKRDRIAEKAREDANRLLQQIRYRSDSMLNQLEDAKKQLNAENAAEMLRKAKTDARKGLEELERAVDPVEERKKSSLPLQNMPSVGDTVHLIALNKDGTVESINEKDQKIQVAVGSMRLWVNLSDAEVAHSTARPRPSGRKVGKGISASKTVPSELDIRGMNSDEGILELDRYLDDAALVGLNTVTIIHGKGTGVLRAAVHSFLRKNSHVKSFRVGLFGEGENGVTIVELK